MLGFNIARHLRAQISSEGGKQTLAGYGAPRRQTKGGAVAYLQAAKARPDLSVPMAFFSAFLVYKVAAGELGGLAIMSAYFIGFLNAKVASIAKARATS
jgi:hypothetical protein